MLSQLRPALVSFGALTLLTGVLYPAVVTAVAKLAFADEASGSLIMRDGHPVGSSLIGQTFSDPGYFWPRPSAAGAGGYDGAAASGSNLGPSNPALHDAVDARVKRSRDAGSDEVAPVPADLVTASGSGLDPHISPAAAEYQVARVARARGMSEAELRRVVSDHTEARTLGVLGEPRVNVVELNLALDRPDAARNAQLQAHNPLGYRWRGFVADSK